MSVVMSLVFGEFLLILDLLAIKAIVSRDEFDNFLRDHFVDGIGVNELGLSEDFLPVIHEEDDKAEYHVANCQYRNHFVEQCYTVVTHLLIQPEVLMVDSFEFRTVDSHQLQGIINHFLGLWTWVQDVLFN